MFTLRSPSGPARGLPAPSNCPQSHQSRLTLAAAAVALMAVLLLACKAPGPTSPKDHTGPTSPPAAKLVVGASLSPDPAAEDFSQLNQWSPTAFRVDVDPGVFDRVQVVANPSGFDNVLEIRTNRPSPFGSGTYCPPERNDRKNVRTGQPFWLEACGSGMATVVIATTNGIPVDTLEFAVGNTPERLTDDWNPAFNIELDYLSEFTPAEKDEIERAARRWETVITADVEDYPGFETSPLEHYEDVLDVTFHFDEAVDDVHVFVVYMDEWPVLGSGAAFFYRTIGKSLPFYGVVILGPGARGISLQRDNLYLIALHELAHVLGFSKEGWNRNELLFNPSKDDPGADTYFYGLNARKAFNQVGGLAYRGGRKVPVENSPSVTSASRDSHWRLSAFGHELMTPYSRTIPSPLSIVTVQAMADLGYEVDISQADEYELPENTAAAKTVAGSVPWCRVLDIQARPAP